MKRYIKIFILVFSLSFLWGCLEDPEVYKVTVKTDSIVEFVQGGVSVSGGIYTENEGYQPTIESSGFCYGLAVGPTLSNFVVKVKKSGIGDFNATLKSLDEGTKYYVRAFAQNKYGVVYGEEVSFVSLTKPTVKTLSLSENNENSQLIVNCELESLGSGDITELGVCYSTEKKLPNKDNDEYKLVSNIQKGKYTVSILVEPNVKYYIRAFASNLAGVAYGEVKEILTTEAIYTIKFDGNGGVGSMSPKTVSVGSSIYLPINTFTRSGYEFVGWNTKADGSGDSYTNGQSITPSGNITLYAQWKKNEVYYTISFNSNGGSGTMYSTEVQEGVNYTLPANTFSRTGYTFIGWNTNVNGNGTSYNDKHTIMVRGNLTLYAQWKKKEVYYTITFNANGGSGSMSSQTVSAGSSFYLPINTLTRSGYEFVGWNTNSYGTGTSYTDGQFITPPGNISLYAQWKKIEEDLDQVSGSHMGHNYVDLGLPSGTLWATCNVGASKPEEYGDYFAWGETSTKFSYTASNYTFTDYETTLPLRNDAANVNWGGDWRMPTKTEQEELRNSSYTIWTWTEQNFVTGYRVTSKINGNSIFLPAAGVMSSSLNEVNRYGNYWSSSYGVNYPIGLYFKSEFVNGSSFYSHQGLSVRPVIPVNSSVEPEQPTLYTLTFNANGGSGSMSSQTVSSGASVTLPNSTFTRSGYEFVGWNTSSDGTGTLYTDGQTITLYGNIALYAQWIRTDIGFHNGHEWVDLGLPSGTLWATCNVGADSPEEYGDYFAWGEIESKYEFNWNTYKWSKGPYTTLTKYCANPSDGSVDNIMVLEISDDAANANWGGDWRLPTRVNQEELRTKCTWTWTSKNGTKGYTIIGPNENSIFLPVAGYFEYYDLYSVNSIGCYWNNSLITSSSTFAYYLNLNSSNVSLSGKYRSNGLSIRPVMDRK